MRWISGGDLGDNPFGADFYSSAKVGLVFCERER
jgi:hypothetical protein